MKTLIFVISLGYALVIGVFIGQLQPRIVTPSQSDIDHAIVMQDRGCDEIIAAENFYTKEMDLVCEIKMTAEDDALFIIKKPGTHDQYK